MVLAAITLLPALLGLAGHRLRTRRPLLRLRLGRRRDPDRGRRRGAAVVALGRARRAARRGVRRRRHDAAPRARRAGTRPAAGTSRRGHAPAVADRAAGLRPGRRGLRARRHRADGRRRRRLAGPVRGGAAGRRPWRPTRASRRPRRPGGRAADVAVLVAEPTTAPQDAATARTIDRVRTRGVARGARRQPGAAPTSAARSPSSPTSVSGSRNGCRWFIVAVVLLSFLLLMVLFRSVLVPLKAAVMNLLSVGAAYGVLVMVFQWGWAREPDRPGVDGADHVVHPAVHVRDPVRAVHGLRGLPALPGAGGVPAHAATTTRRSCAASAGTARTITSAPLIMVAVFVGFVLGDDPW